MKRTMLCLAAMMALVATAQAGEINTSKGAQQLVFQFGGLDHLSADAYNGGFGVRHYMNDGLAVVPGLAFSRATSTSTGSISDGPHAVNPADITDAKTRDAAFGLSLAIEKHHKGSENISPYVGGGIEWNRAVHTVEPSYVQNPGPTVLTKRVTTLNEYGVFAMTGFEWAFTKSMTLGAEYRLGLAYDYGKLTDTMGGVNRVTSNVDGWNAGLSAASLFLSVEL